MRSLRPFLLAAFALSLLGGAHALAAFNRVGDDIFRKNEAWTVARATMTSVHFPFRTGDCVACHADSKDLKALLWPERKLCLSCHGGVERLIKGEKAGIVVHGALEAAECTACHDPHASKEPKLLIKDACAGCHDPASEPLAKAHFGVKAFKGSCAGCHVGHSSPRPKLLQNAKQHPPFAARACATCHQAPGAAGEMSLKDDLSATCLKCHEGRRPGGPDAEHPHRPENGVDCSACHSGHMSLQGGMPTADLAGSCRDCHEGIPAMGHPEYSHPSFRRGVPDPLRKGSEFTCATCHDPHGERKAKMLRKPLNTLCLECHPK